MKLINIIRLITVVVFAVAASQCASHDPTSTEDPAE